MVSHLPLPAAVVDEPHRPHGVRLSLALELGVPARHYQSRHDRSQPLPPSCRVPVLEADPDVRPRCEPPRADQRVEEGGSGGSRRRGERGSVRRRPDKSLALQGEAGQVAPVGVEAAGGAQPAVGERRQGEVVLEEERGLGGPGAARPPRGEPLAVEAGVAAVDVDADAAVRPAEAARRHQRAVVDVAADVAVDPDLQRHAVAVQLQIVHRTVHKHVQASVCAVFRLHPHAPPRPSSAFDGNLPLGC